MKNQYNKTVTACFVGYIVQAIVNNFVPLLFLGEYGIVKSVVRTAKAAYSKKRAKLKKRRDLHGINR